MRVTGLAAASIMVVLGSCAQIGGTAPAPGGEALPPPVDEALPAPVEDATKDEARVAALPDEKTAPLPRPKPKPKPPEAFNPDGLIGLSQDETRHLLGGPTSTREEPPAKVWIYESTDCSLHVFFYLDLASQTFQALAFDVKTKDGSDYAMRACLVQLQKRYVARRR